MWFYFYGSLVLCYSRTGTCSSSSSCAASNLLFCVYSDYIIKEKTVLLQKKDSEGFGFVLRGAKGD